MNRRRSALLCSWDYLQRGRAINDDWTEENGRSGCGNICAAGAGSMTGWSAPPTA